MGSEMCIRDSNKGVVTAQSWNFGKLLRDSFKTGASKSEKEEAEDLYNYYLLNTKQAKKNMPLSQIVNLIKEDTGENPAKAWKPKLLMISSLILLISSFLGLSSVT